jgi:hypothetical protein
MPMRGPCRDTAHMSAAVAVTLAVALIAAAASVVAAMIASRALASVQAQQARADRVGALEERLAHHKYDLYAPMLDLLNDMILGVVKVDELPEAERQRYQDMSANFGTWLAVFGSDEAVAAYHRWSQATFHQPIPNPILFRLWADLMLAARRDIGDADTATTVTELLGLRLRDLYEVPDHLMAVELPLDELCARFDWTPPWDLPQDQEAAKRPPSLG